MINLDVYKKSVNDKQQKNKMTTKQALSMQATVQNAMINRSPRNPNGQVQNTTTVNGYGRSM